MAASCTERTVVRDLHAIEFPEISSCVCVAVVRQITPVCFELFGAHFSSPTGEQQGLASMWKTLGVFLSGSQDPVKKVYFMGEMWAWRNAGKSIEDYFFANTKALIGTSVKAYRWYPLEQEEAMAKKDIANAAGQFSYTIRISVAGGAVTTAIRHTRADAKHWWTEVRPDDVTAQYIAGTRPPDAEWTNKTPHRALAQAV